MSEAEGGAAAGGQAVLAAAAVVASACCELASVAARAIGACFVQVQMMHTERKAPGSARPPRPPRVELSRVPSSDEAAARLEADDVDNETDLGVVVPPVPGPGLRRERHGGGEDDTTARALGEFRAAPRVGAKVFERAWADADQVDVWGATLRELPLEGAFMKLFEHGRAYCLASGQVGNVRKFYFYSQRERGGRELAMAEFSLAVDTLRLSCVFKDTSAAAASTSAFVAFMKATVSAHCN